MFSSFVPINIEPYHTYYIAFTNAECANDFTTQICSTVYFIDESMVLVNEEPNFTVGLSNSYRCLKQQTLPLTKNGTNQTAGYLTISGFQFQAFKADNSTLFGLGTYCIL